MNKSSTITIVVLVVLVLAGFGLWSAIHSAKAETGSVVLAFTDASANIKNVSEVDMTVNKVEAHSQANGWITLSSNPKTYHLLALNQSGQLAFYDKVDAPAGIYDQVKVTMGDVTVKLSDKSSKKAYLPSTSMTINDTVRVVPSQNSVLTFDVKASESIHATTNGQYVFTPVVSYRSLSNASVNLNNDDTVSIGSGETASSGNVGMDLSGETRSNFMVDANANLNIDSSGAIMLGATSTGNTSSSSSSKSLLTPIGASSTTSGGGVINY